MGRIHDKIQETHTSVLTVAGIVVAVVGILVTACCGILQIVVGLQSSQQNIYLYFSDQVRVEVTPSQNDCFLYVRQPTLGINIYPYDVNKTFDVNKIGTLFPSDGPIKVEKIIWGEGPDGRWYKWAVVTVRGISGLVHAEPHWVQPSATCN